MELHRDVFLEWIRSVSVIIRDGRSGTATILSNLSWLWNIEIRFIVEKQADLPFTVKRWNVTVKVREWRLLKGYSAVELRYVGCFDEFTIARCVQEVSNKVAPNVYRRWTLCVSCPFHSILICICAWFLWMSLRGDDIEKWWTTLAN